MPAGLLPCRAAQARLGAASSPASAGAAGGNGDRLTPAELGHLLRSLAPSEPGHDGPQLTCLSRGELAALVGRVYDRVNRRYAVAARRAQVPGWLADLVEE